MAALCRCETRTESLWLRQQQRNSDLSLLHWRRLLPCTGRCASAYRNPFGLYLKCPRNAAECAPSKASKADISTCPSDVRFSQVARRRATAPSEKRLSSSQPDSLPVRR